MAKSELYQALEKDFTETFIHELLPGILHNFANPLNGIMGRSKLLQRRIDDALKKMAERYPDTADNLKDEFQKIKSDILSINKESESFFEMFRDVSGKFYALVGKGNERINLSSLLAAEIRFSDFYLEFKHEVNKHIEIDYEIPDFQGNIADFSLAFWRLLRFAMNKAQKSPEKDFFLKTSRDSENIIVTMLYSGDALTSEEHQQFVDALQNDAPVNRSAVTDSGVVLALLILRQYPSQVQFFVKDKKNVIEITFSYRKTKD